jgi:hypothetical protein
MFMLRDIKTIGAHHEYAENTKHCPPPPNSPKKITVRQVCRESSLLQPALHKLNDE